MDDKDYVGMYLILPLQKEMHDYTNTFLEIGCDYKDIINVIPEFLRYYSYDNIELKRNELFNIDIIRQEIFKTLLSSKSINLPEYSKPTYLAVFNYFLDRLLSVWKTVCFRPLGIQTICYPDLPQYLDYDLNGKVGNDIPLLETYYATHVFHEVKDLNIIVRPIND